MLNNALFECIIVTLIIRRKKIDFKRFAKDFLTLKNLIFVNDYVLRIWLWLILRAFANFH